MAAIRILGKRIFQIILYSVVFSVPLNRMRSISDTEISTFPVLIFSTVITKNAAVNTRNTRKYLERRLKFSI